jgi:hypothetical protein
VLLVLCHAVTSYLHYTLLLLFRCDLHCIFDNQNCWNITSCSRSKQHSDDNTIFKALSKFYFPDFFVITYIWLCEKSTFGQGLNLQMPLTRLPMISASRWAQNYSTAVTVHQCGDYHTFWIKTYTFFPGKLCTKFSFGLWSKSASTLYVT